MSHRWSSLFALLSATATAQTFVVDAASGPGSHYSTIAAAVAAVPDNATLLVRPGVYGTFRIQAKGLKVLGGPGVDVDILSNGPWGIVVENTGVHQPVVLRGLRLISCYLTAGISNCAGAVLFEDIDVAPCSQMMVPYATYSVWNSSQVMLRNCGGSNSSCSGSGVVFERCALWGSDAYYLFGHTGPSYPALQLTGGTTQIVDCTLVGGRGNFGWTILPNRPGLNLMNASVRVLAPSVISAGASSYFSPEPAIAGTGTLRLDPAVALNTTAQPPIAATIATQVVVMPAVRGTSASLGAILVGEALGPVGNLVILVVGLPGNAVSVPGIGDPFWLDPATYSFFAIGTPQSGAPLMGTILVPNFPGLLGLSIGWQSVTAGVTGLMASNPSVSLVR